MRLLRDSKPHRWASYNYSTEGHYFVTICTKKRMQAFGEIHNMGEGNCELRLNLIGEIARQCWSDIPLHFSGVGLDAYVIMPDHIHGIIIIHNNPLVLVEDNDRCPLPNDILSSNRNMELLPKIISQYKSSVSREIRKQLGDYHFGWQRSFYDHIIRKEESLNNIRQYIFDNPQRWLNKPTNEKSSHLASFQLHYEIPQYPGRGTQE